MAVNSTLPMLLTFSLGSSLIPKTFRWWLRSVVNKPLPPRWREGWSLRNWWTEGLRVVRVPVVGISFVIVNPFLDCYSEMLWY